MEYMRNAYKNSIERLEWRSPCVMSRRKMENSVGINLKSKINLIFD
jgi:hypothetical protein